MLPPSKKHSQIWVGVLVPVTLGGGLLLLRNFISGFDALDAVSASMWLMAAYLLLSCFVPRSWQRGPLRTTVRQDLLVLAPSVVCTAAIAYYFPKEHGDSFVPVLAAFAALSLWSLFAHFWLERRIGRA